MPADRADVLLDTHALLWWQAGSPRMSPTARATIESGARLLVSPITCWEVGMLVAKGRVRLDRPTAAWVRDLLAQSRIEPSGLETGTAVAAAELPDFHGDPADRLLYATARSWPAVLLTKDEALQRYARRHGDVVVTW